jgi:hypothetical protein
MHSGCGLFAVCDVHAIVYIYISIEVVVPAAVHGRHRPCVQQEMALSSSLPVRRDAYRDLSNVVRHQFFVKFTFDRHSAPSSWTLVFGYTNIRSMSHKLDDLLQASRDNSLNVLLIV